MEKTRMKKIITVVLLVVFILHFCLAIIHVTHDCTHEDNCPICSVIKSVNEKITGYSNELLKAVTQLIVLLSLVISFKNIIKQDIKTPVGLKVELLN